MPQLDYAGIMAAGQSLVPNLREQMLQRMQVENQARQVEMQAQAFRAKQAEAAQAQQREADFQRDVAAASQSADPHAIQQLMLKYPEMAETIKPVFDSLEEGHRTAEVTHLGSIWTRGQAGDYAGAAGILERRIASDKAAGEDTEDEERILADLKSGVPAQQKAALGEVGIMLAAVTGDKFGETYGKLNPSDSKTPVEKEYEWRVGRFGQQAADEWLNTQDVELVVGQPGAPVFDKRDFVRPPARGGDPGLGGGGGIVATPEQEAQSRAFEQAFGMEGVTVDDRTGTVYNADGSVRGGVGASNFAMPVEGGSFTQPAQQFHASRDGGSRAHNGLDISGPLGAPVRAMAAGVVVDVGSDPASGNYVKVRLPDGTVTSYSHLGEQSVAKGQQVEAGVSLGTLGRSGNARAGQGRGVLHLVVRRNGRPVDPRPLLGGATRVATRQQYDRLPSGTHYTAPDGSQRVKP